MADHDAQGRDLFICGKCKCRRTRQEFEVDRHGHRRKCCIPCKQNRRGLYVRFISGLQEHYGLTVDDLDDYVYVGGDRKGRLTYFRLKYPGEVIPEHSQTCVCGHAIEENCFIRNTQTGHTLIIGTCCNKNFVTTSGKNCQDCGAPHRNKVVDRCNDCRRSKCDDCGARCRPAYKTCYSCYTARSGKTVSSQTVTVTTAPVKDHPCVECGAERKACDDWHSIHGGPEGICGGCWNTHYHYWRSRYDTVTPRHVVVDSVSRELKSKFPKAPQLTDDEVNSLLAEYGF